MKELLSSKSFKKLICTLVVIAVLMGISAFSDTSLVSSVLSSLTLGMQQVTAEVAKDASQKSYDELLRENEKLEQELSTLRTQLVDYYETKEENARLWKYYDLKKEYPQYEVMPASVIRRDPGDSFYSFTINRGKAVGISVGDPVVTDKGLVGWISAVDLSTARVKTILSPDAKVGSIDAVSRDTGVVSGSVSLSDKGLTSMTKIPAQNTMKAGDIVITTGISGLYPATLMIGEVEEILFDEYDTSKYAVIKPFEDIRTVTDVVVITDFDGQGEISTGSVEDITLPAVTADTGATAPTAETGAR